MNSRRKLLVAGFLFINLLVSARTYYVSTTGKDSNPGTFSNPWLTWNYAFNRAIAGDTVFFRGGVYNVTQTQGASDGPSGTAANPICFFNYPNEIPILDGTNKTSMSYGVGFNRVEYINIKGLVVRNHLQLEAENDLAGFGFTFCKNIRIENCVAHHIGVRGFYFYTCDNIYVINCDAYNCVDALTDGAHGDGYLVWDMHSTNYYQDTTAYVYFKGCRAWNCADDGWDAETEGTIVLDSCWAFISDSNFNYGINGFKLGLTDIESNNLGKRITHCIAAFEPSAGFVTNDNNCPAKLMKVYNNLAYHNSTGFKIFDTSSSDAKEAKRTFKNNIAYGNTGGNLFLGGSATYTHDHNSWDIPLSLTDNDFISLDGSQLSGPRKPNGSLPDITFGTLKTGSKCIDAGTYLGLPYFGSAPDIGAFEYSAGNPNPKLVTSITVSGAGGATAITANRGTLQLIAAVLPSDATNKTVTWSVINGTGMATINSSGLVTAAANGTVTTRATANDGSGIFGTLVITISNQAVPVTSISVTGAGGATAITADGGSLQLSAVVLPANATNKAVTWSITSGSNRASINSATGLVTAIDNGTVTVRATANDGSGIYGTLVITISNQIVPVTSISVTGAGGASTITTDGGSLQLSTVVLPANASNKTVTWSITSGSNLASINSSGSVTAIDNGTVTVRATANDGSGIYGTSVITISNQVVSVTSIAVTGAGGANTITTDKGTLQLIAVISPSNATNKTITWSIVYGTGQASISVSGLVSAIASGTVTAKATANDGSGVSGSLVITISNQLVPVTSITVTGAGGANTITSDNGTLQLNAAISPSNASNKTFTWSVVNGTGQALISVSGLVTAVASGTVTAKATANDGSGVSGSLIITISNQTVPVTSITVTGAGGANTIFTDTGTLQLSAAILPSNATNKSITWSIINVTGQATINSSGLVTAVATGTVTARATANDGSGVTGTLTITISNQLIAVTGITVTGAGGSTSITVNNGALQLMAAVLPSDATNKTVTWSVINGTGQANVTSSGLVTAAANGTVTARATANDGSGIYGTLVIDISNQVVPVTGISVTGAGGATTIASDGGSLQLSALVLPADASNKTVTWSITSGSNLASINSSTGLVTAIDNGTVTVRATANDGSGIYGTLVIAISNQVVPVTSITVTGAGGATAITANKGTLQLMAAVLPSDATNKTVTWSVVNGTGLAIVSSSGLVTASANGTITARATANDGSGIYGTLIITIINQVIPVTSISVRGAGGASAIAADGGSLQLSALVLPANASNKTVIWSITSGSNLASISSSTGLVTAIDNGTVTVRATANDGSGIYGTLVIAISNQLVPLTSITVTGAGGASTITTDGGSLQLIATVSPTNAINKTVTWSITSGSGLSSINSSTGLVTAINNGTITVRATANDGSGIYGTLVITISNQVIPVTGITVTGAGGANTISSDKGTLQLNAVISPSNATNKTFTWSIVNGTGKASISLSGLVSAIAGGTVTAKATANDGSGVSGSLIITINVPPVIVVNYKPSSYAGFVAEINASGSYDPNKDNLTFTWTVPGNIPVSSTTGSSIKYLGPPVSTAQKVEFTLRISDGKITQSKVVPVEILPYKPELEVAEILNIEASTFKTPFYPYNVIDGNIGTMWSAEGENQWLLIELMHPFDIQHISLAFQPGQKRESYFDVLGSVDKINWEPILVKSASCSFSGDIQAFEFPLSKSGKRFDFIKLVGKGNSNDSWNYISELKIYGYRHRNSPSYEKLPVKIYPNPAWKSVTVRIDEANLLPEFMQIVSMSGIVLLKVELDPGLRVFTIPLDLIKGKYILQLCTGRITLFTQKLIVAN